MVQQEPRPGVEAWDLPRIVTPHNSTAAWGSSRIYEIFVDNLSGCTTEDVSNEVTRPAN